MALNKLLVSIEDNTKNCNHQTNYALREGFAFKKLSQLLNDFLTPEVALVF